MEYVQVVTPDAEVSEHQVPDAQVITPLMHEVGLVFQAQLESVNQLCCAKSG